MKKEYLKPDATLYPYDASAEGAASVSFLRFEKDKALDALTSTSVSSASFGDFLLPQDYFEITFLQMERSRQRCLLHDSAPRWF